MTESNAVSAQPTPPKAESGADVKGGGNVGVNQAVARMLKMEQAQAVTNAPAESVAPAEETTATTELPATDAAQATSAEETAAEPTAQAEGQPEAESEDALSHEESNLDPKLREQQLKDQFNRRIGKEVSKRKLLEARLNELTVAMQQAQAQPKPQEPVSIAPLPAGAPPLANIEDAHGLQALAQQAKEAKRWAEEQLDNEVSEVRMGDQTLGKAELKSIVRNANRTLEDLIPQRAQFLAQRDQMRPLIQQRYPFLSDKSSPDYVESQAILRANPWLRSLPTGDAFLGAITKEWAAIRSEAQKQGQAPAKAKGAPAPKPPTSQAAIGSNGVATPRVAIGTRNDQQISAIRQAQSKKGGVTANEAIAALTKIEQLKSR